MKILYLDCFAGISGDMCLGAMIDLGVSLDSLSDRLDRLGLTGFRLIAEKSVKNGISGTKATVHLLGPQPHHRHLQDIVHIIENSSLPVPVKENSIAAFHRLAAAEAKIHNIPVEKVHFHEVGAIDAIIDIVGTFCALDLLGVDKVICSPLPLGAGFVKCAHGVLPLPAPAALELLKGVPTITTDIYGETVTPTGAALVTTMASSFGQMPSMRISSIGYGAGLADRQIPNMLRAVIGESAGEVDGLDAGDPGAEWLRVLESNIDDMNPEFYDYILEKLFDAGALDVFLTPVIMKKGRPGQLITCLAKESHVKVLIDILLTETTTLGVRSYPTLRFKLAREIVAVNTTYGQVRVKLGLDPATGEVKNIAPEWEDCKTIASKNNIPVKTIYDIVKAEAYKDNNF